MSALNHNSLAHSANNPQINTQTPHMTALRRIAFRAALAASLFPFLPSPSQAKEVVAFSQGSPGTIVVRTNQRRLYLIMSGGKAMRYVVGVGRAGKQWFGTTYINGKYIKPAWSPPAQIKRDRPKIPNVIPGGTPSNPMGAAALVLADEQLAIHGTNRPGSIGGFVSYGCIRMHNSDIMDLYERVGVGTRVLIER